MEKIDSIDEVVELIAKIKNLRKGFISNFYLDKEKHSLWIEKGDLYYELIGNTLFLIKKNVGFVNVFYVSTSLDELKENIGILNNNSDETMMMDIVDRKEDCENITKAFLDLGFTLYCQLMRMSRKTSDVVNNLSNDVVFATREEAQDVLALLHKYFDERAEQIPYIEELEEYASQKRILLKKIDKKIVGFVIFEISRVSLYLRYWFVHPDYRERGVGSDLLRRYFYEGKETKMEQLWVICNNENAIKRYRHYGYNDENMFDYVITNK